jgi:hypothetical protein
LLVRLEPQYGQPEISEEGKTQKRRSKMHPEQPECRFCGGCLDKYENYTGLNVQDGQWLEEMGEMIAESVERMRKVQSFSAYCHERLATGNNLYT